MMVSNLYVNKVQTADGSVIMDISSDTVTPSDVLNGVTFHDRSGAAQQGSVITHNVYDGLDSTSTSDALSANQGKVINNKRTITSIGESKDGTGNFNNLVTPGVYAFRYNNAITNWTNKPCSIAGKLFVDHLYPESGVFPYAWGMLQQRYETMNGETYKRKALCDGNGTVTWSNWDSINEHISNLTKDQNATLNTTYIDTGSSAKYSKIGKTVIVNIAVTLKATYNSLQDALISELPANACDPVWFSLTGYSDNKNYRLRLNGTNIEYYYGATLPAQAYTGSFTYFTNNF